MSIKKIILFLLSLACGFSSAEAMNFQQKEARTSLSTLLKEGSVQDLNNAANIMLVSARLYDVLTELTVLIPKLKEYQDARIVDRTKGSFVRVYGFHPTESFAIELSRKTRFGDVYGFYTNDQDTQAFMLQIAHILRYPDSSFNNENIQRFEGILQSEAYSNEIKILSEMALHALYATKFYLAYHDAPHILKKVSTIPVKYYRILPLVMKEGLKCTNNVTNFVNALKLPQQIFILAAELDYCYRAYGDDHDDSIIVTKKFSTLANKIIALSGQFERFKNEYNNLYKILIKTLMYKGRKNNIQVHEYKARNKYFFSANYVKKHRKKIHDYRLLPAELWDIGKQNNNVVKKEKKKSIRKKLEEINLSSQKVKSNILKPIDKQKVSQQKSWAQIAAIKPKMQLNNKLIISKSDLHATKYDARVMRWLDKKSTDQEVINSNDKSVLYHSFPLCADKYIFSLGIQTDWQNQTDKKQIDTNYSLGGEIIFNNGARKHVVFTCCKDPYGVCYHRGFTEKENNALFDEYFSKSCWEISFPKINDIGQYKQVEYSYQKTDDYGSHVISENQFCIRIKDNKNNVTIVLYKPYKK